MSLIPTNTPQEAVVLIQQNNGARLDNLKSMYQSSFDEIWNNPVGTPQQILNGFGASAAKLFQSAGLLIQLIKVADPSYVPPTPPLPYTINKNGTVQIN